LKSTVALPRGVRDIEPDEYSYLEYIRSAFTETCELFGFRVMEPATLEFLSTLEAKSGPAIADEIYWFRDKGGRRIALRFDLTVGLTRYACSKRELPLPIKLAALGDMWRYDEPQYGRYRWFHQWDVEIFGVPHIEADAEVILFGQKLLERLGLADVELHVGDRKTVESFLRRDVGVSDESVILDMLRALDKLSRKPKSEVIGEYVQRGVRPEFLERAFSFGELKGEPDAVCDELDRRGFDSSGLRRLWELLKAGGARRVVYDLGLTRGIDYYTGVVFEYIDPQDPGLGSLAGGGRYDILPQVFGRGDLGATGAAGGIERTILAMRRRAQPARGDEPRRGVLVAYTTPELLGRAVELCYRIRDRGVRAEYDLLRRPLRRQMDIASRYHRWAIILGPREVSAGRAVLRDLLTGREEELPIDHLPTALSNYAK
jgi:histidyl-tRNA synthetase